MDDDDDDDDDDDRVRHVTATMSFCAGCARLHERTLLCSRCKSAGFCSKVCGNLTMPLSVIRHQHYNINPSIIYTGMSDKCMDLAQEYVQSWIITSWRCDTSSIFER